MLRSTRLTGMNLVLLLTLLAGFLFFAFTPSASASPCSINYGEADPDVGTSARIGFGTRQNGDFEIPVISATGVTAGWPYTQGTLYLTICKNGEFFADEQVNWVGTYGTMPTYQYDIDSQWDTYEAQVVATSGFRTEYSTVVCAENGDFGC